ncbi:hypothetical protein [Thiohalospira sp.]|uniref:hypothetical protein n=1 Tax=Thiohalospira sp. TaxID=3080549 RepID=UPI0039801F2D
MADGTGSGRDRPLIAALVAAALLASPLLAVWARPAWGWLAPYAVWAAILGVTALLLHAGHRPGDRRGGDDDA